MFNQNALEKREQLWTNVLFMILVWEPCQYISQNSYTIPLALVSANSGPEEGGNSSNYILESAV